jgi:AcrR family transcriptional regulator
MVIRNSGVKNGKLEKGPAAGLAATVPVAQLRDRLVEVKREEIMRVAGELFFAKGFTQTSMEEIATRLSIGKPQIYACFPSKTALMKARRLSVPRNWLRATTSWPG